MSMAPPARTRTCATFRADRLVKLPAAISDEQAAALMLKGLTAEYLLRRTYRVQARRLSCWCTPRPAVSARC